MTKPLSTPALTNGTKMFSKDKLDEAAALRVLSTIPDLTSTPTSNNEP